MMKKILMMLAVLALLVPALALADGPVLLVELSEGAEMIEDVQFDDGDFIQTYQLDGGATVQLLRYAAFGMTLDELAEGEWTGYTALRALPLAQVGAWPAQGLRLDWAQEGEAVDVTLLLVQAGDQALLLQAVYPQAIGQDAIDASVQALLDSLDVLDQDMPVDDEAEVG